MEVRLHTSSWSAFSGLSATQLMAASPPPPAWGGLQGKSQGGSQGGIFFGGRAAVPAMGGAWGGGCGQGRPHRIGWSGRGAPRPWWMYAGPESSCSPDVATLVPDKATRAFRPR